MTIFICSKCRYPVNTGRHSSPWPLGDCPRCGSHSFKRPSKKDWEYLYSSEIKKGDNLKETVVKALLIDHTKKVFNNTREIQVSIKEKSPKVIIKTKDGKKRQLTEEELKKVESKIKDSLDSDIDLLDNIEKIKELEDYGKYADMSLEKKVRNAKNNLDDI